MRWFVSLVPLLLLLFGQIWIAESTWSLDGGGAIQLADCMLGITNGHSSSMDTVLTSFDCMNGIFSSMDGMKANEMKAGIEYYATEYIKGRASEMFENYLESLHKSSDENIRNWARLVLEVYRTTVNAMKKVDILQRSLERLVLSGILVQPATKWALGVGQFAAPVGILADLGELGLKLMGYEHEGRVVGAVGNTVSGAMIGFSMGGLPGAAVGGALGFGMWKWNDYTNARYLL